MSMEHWWPRLTPESRAWLVAHNGEALPADVVAEITRVGGDVTSDQWWVGEVDNDGPHLSDDAVDWIESVANDEDPEPPVTS